MRTLFTFAAVVVLMADGARRGDAAFFTSPAAFTAATAGRPQFTQTFDASLPGFDTFPTPASVTFNSGTGFGYTVSGGTLLYQSVDRGLNNTPFLGIISNGLYLNFAFTGGVTAFSGYFFETLIDDTFYANQPVTLAVSNGDTFTFTPASVAGSFVGYVSPGGAITSLTIPNSVDFNNAYHAFDSFTAVAGPSVIPNPVPLPPTAALAGVSGLAALAGVARRRGQSARTPR